LLREDEPTVIRVERGLPYTRAVHRLANVAGFLLVSVSGFAGSKQMLPTLRWTENTANCTFRYSDDGRIYYGLSSGDFEITLAVDRQELEKIPHRARPMIGVFLNFKYKGSGKFEVLQNKMYLEFIKHRQVVKGSLDPDDMVQHLQENVDDLTDEVERYDIKKHPELKGQKESELQQRLKDYTEMIDFISTRALKPVTLDSSNSSAGGWVFFSIQDKWIGPWRKPEEFVLSFPVENLMVEFPFTLPPKGAKVEFRKRPGE
jgi:hypothetical protein